MSNQNPTQWGGAYPPPPGQPPSPPGGQPPNPYHGYGGPGGQPPGHSHRPVQPPKSGSGRKVATIIITIFSVLMAGMLLVCGVAGWFLYKVEAEGPGTSAVSGAQMKSRHAEIIEELGLLEPGEEIQMFYSDAIRDIRNGMYLLTSRHLILYNREWTEPAAIIPYRDIISVDYTQSDSWLFDSMFTVETEDAVYTFPVSVEGGGHHRYHEIITSRMGSD